MLNDQYYSRRAIHAFSELPIALLCSCSPFVCLFSNIELTRSTKNRLAGVEKILREEYYQIIYKARLKLFLGPLCSETILSLLGQKCYSIASKCGPKTRNVWDIPDLVVIKAKRTAKNINCLPSFNVFQEPIKPTHLFKSKVAILNRWLYNQI